MFRAASEAACGGRLSLLKALASISTGRPCVGLKGTVVSLPQTAQNSDGLDTFAWARLKRRLCGATAFRPYIAWARS